MNKALYLDIAKHWNTEDKKVIAQRNGVTVFGVQIIARTIAKKTGLYMRPQRTTNVYVYTDEFIKELKEVYGK